MMHSTPTFPHDLEPPAARSLSLLFVLQEFLFSCQCVENEKLELSQLDKLSFYCEILLQASKTQDESVLKLLDEMRSILQRMRRSNHDMYHALQTKLLSFFETLTGFLTESRTDENVLLYLVEHTEKFNTHLGPKTIENLLSQFFPAGPHELRAAICEGYTRRGFYPFYLDQEPMLDALEWETSEN